MASREDRGESRFACRHRGCDAAEDQRGASSGGLFVRRSKRILGTNLLEDDRVGSRERSGLRRPFRRTRRDRERVCLDRNESETCERNGGRQIRTCERCLSEELEFVRIHWPLDNQGDDPDDKPIYVCRDLPWRLPACKAP